MEFQIVGADLEDPGPKGVVARFMVASVNGASEAAIEMLTVESREGMEINVPPGERGVATIGEVVTEGDLFIVPTTTEDDDGSQEMEFVVREEDGTLRIDMDACMARAMGMSPDELMDQVGGAIAETMGGMMDGMADAIGGALGGVLGGAPDDDKDKPADPAGLPGKIWTLAEHAFDPDDIMNVAYELAESFAGTFDPPMAQLTTVESAEEGATYRTTRFGDASQGFERIQGVNATDSNIADSIVVTAHGMPEGHEFGLTWARSPAPGTGAMVAVRLRGPAGVVAAMDRAIGGGFEVLSTVEF